MDCTLVSRAFKRLRKPFEWRVLDDQEMTQLTTSVCRSLEDKPSPSQKALNLAVMEAYHGIVDRECPTERVAGLLFGPDAYDEYPEWIPFDRALTLLTPSLWDVHFIDRCLGAMKILDWSYGSIAAQFNAVLPSHSPVAMNGMKLDASFAVWREFHDRMHEAMFTEAQEHKNWFRELLNRQDAWQLDYAALAVMMRFSEHPPKSRFERGGERHAILRDRWSDVKKFLAEHADPCGFTANGGGEKVTP